MRVLGSDNQSTSRIGQPLLFRDSFSALSVPRLYSVEQQSDEWIIKAWEGGDRDVINIPFQYLPGGAGENHEAMLKYYIQ